MSLETILKNIWSWLKSIISSSVNTPTATTGQTGTVSTTPVAIISAVYTGTANKYADDMPVIRTNRKPTLFFNMMTEKMEKLTAELQLNNTPMELNAKHDTKIQINTTYEHSGNYNAYMFPSPETNGYPAGEHAAAIVIRDQETGKEITRHTFTLIME